MKRVNKFISLLLSLCLCLSGISVYAADITSAGSTGNSPVTLEMESSSFSVSLPLGLLVEVTRDGDIYTATECAIINNSRSPIVVDDVLVETDSPWVLEEFDAAYYSMPVNTSKLGFQLNTENVGLDGKVALDRGNWPVIYGYDEMELDYDANLPAVSEDKETVMGKVIFTIDFWSGDSDSNTIISSTKFDSSIFDIKDEYQFNVDVKQESVTIETPNEDSLWVWTTNDDSTLTIVGYNGDLDDSQDIVVPSEINGAAVTTLASGTFNGGNDFTVNSMSIPEGITVEAKALYCINADTVNIANDCVLEAKSLALCDVENLYIGEGIALPGGRTATSTSQGRNKNPASTILGNSNNVPGGSVTNLYLNSDATPGSFEDCYIDNIIFGEGCDSIGRYAFSVADTVKSFKGIENIKFFGRNCFGQNGDSGYIAAGGLIDDSFKSDLIITSETTVEVSAFLLNSFNNIILKAGANVDADAFIRINAESFSIEDVSLIEGVEFTVPFFKACNIEVLNIDGNIPDYFGWNFKNDALNGKNNYRHINLGPNVKTIGTAAFGIRSATSGTWASYIARDYPIESITGLENVESLGRFTFGQVNMNEVVFADGANISMYVFENSEIGTISVGPNTTYGSDLAKNSGAEIIVREE